MLAGQMIKDQRQDVLHSIFDSNMEIYKNIVDYTIFGEMFRKSDI